MISTNDIKTASFEVRSKAKQTHAYERGNRVLVVPKDEQKQIRLVEFNGTTVTCVAFETGELCPANECHAICYHVFSAYKRRQRNKKWRRTYFSNRKRAA